MKGLKEWPKDQRPNSTAVFWSFRIMVGIGMLMILVGVVSLFLRWLDRLYAAPLFHRACIAMGPSGFVALLAGWITTEMGRQPWLVYGHLRTADGISPVLPANVAVTLATFVVVYFVVFGIGAYYLMRLMVAGPEVVPSPAPPTESEAAGGMRPLSAAPGEAQA